MLYDSMLERLVTYRHSSLLVLFEIYEEGKVEINQHYTCQLLCCIRTKNKEQRISWASIHNASFSSLLVNEPYKLEFYIISEWKGLPGTGTLAL
jgi:hypothetical protein